LPQQLTFDYLNKTILGPSYYALLINAKFMKMHVLHITLDNYDQSYEKYEYFYCTILKIRQRKAL
jgi:hypothetical protein